MGNLYVVPRNVTGRVPERCRRRADAPFSYAIAEQLVERLEGTILDIHTVYIGSRRE